MGVPALSSVEVQTNPNEESPVRGTGLWALKESKDPLPNRCSRKKKNSIREVTDGVIRRPNVKRKQVSDENSCSRSRWLKRGDPWNGLVNRAQFTHLTLLFTPGSFSTIQDVILSLVQGEYTKKGSHKLTSKENSSS